jgi:hypothetical protein
MKPVHAMFSRLKDKLLRVFNAPMSFGTLHKTTLRGSYGFEKGQSLESYLRLTRGAEL